jgi:NAD(P)-dependent dehydrogenase (short-subunit alcohol dehydrogenase family)
MNNKVTLVSGAHAWLGWDMACALAEAGSHIIITSRSIERAEETAERLKMRYPKVSVLGLKMDQSSIEQIEDCFNSALQWKGHLDVLINNAGGGSGKSSGDILNRSAEDAEMLIRVNLIGVLHCCQKAAKIMSAQKTGSIINIASMAGLIGRDRRMYEDSNINSQPVDYSAAKSGVIGLTRDLAASLGRYGVRVNSISPGGFDKGVLPKRFTSDLADATMLGRWGKMGTDIKGAALYLASDASAYVTAHNLVVDGGFSVFK